MGAEPRVFNMLPRVLTRKYQLRVVAIFRLAFGVLTLVALGVQFRTSQSHPQFNAVSFFSYFTNLSNIKWRS